MSDNKENIKSIDTKLREIVKCIVKHARKSPAFADDLMAALNISQSSDSSEPFAPRSPTTIFNPIEILHEEGAGKLKSELSLLTDTELMKVVKDNKYKITVDPKKGIERELFIEEIIDYSSRQLTKGSSFLKDNLRR